MTKIILHGCNGRMGQMLTGLLKEDPEAEVAAGVDGYTGIANEYPVFASIDECDVPADVVIDFSNAKAADGLLDFIQKATGKRSFRRPRIAVCVPSGVTEVEKKAVEDATYQAGAREVMIIEEPIAAAIGAGIDISRPCGNMIVDIGGGTSDIAVISLGGAVVSTSVKIAGDCHTERNRYYR